MRATVQVMKAVSTHLFTGAFLMFATSASATTNFVKNGSFENGLAGFSIGGSATDGYLPVAIDYNQSSGYPTGAQGESVPVDNATSLSPDAAGNKGVYFVTDEANNLSLYQTIYLTPGSYDIGFDSYDTFNGNNQPHDAILTAKIAGIQLANFSLASVSPGVWSSHSGKADITTAGNYLVSFAFSTPDTPPNPDPLNPGGEYNAKDVIIDRVYVVSDASGGGTPISAVPETATWAMMMSGFGLIGGLMRRAHRKSEDKFTEMVRNIANA